MRVEQTQDIAPPGNNTSSKRCLKDTYFETLLILILINVSGHMYAQTG